MSTRILILVGTLFSFSWFGLGCTDGSTGPEDQSPILEFSSFDTSDPLALFDLLGVEQSGLQSLFMLEWASLVDLNGETKSQVVRAFARAFDPNQEGNSFQFPGLNMGTVSFLRISADTLSARITLPGRFSPISGQTYEATRPGFVAFELVEGDVYQVEREGAFGFAPLLIEMTVPPSNISLTEASLTTTIGLEPSLRLNWEGGRADQPVLLTLQPVARSDAGVELLSGTAEMLGSNPGEFVLPEESLGMFIAHAHSELTQAETPHAELAGILAFVAQALVTEVRLFSGDVLAIAVTSDQVFLPLN